MDRTAFERRLREELETLLAASEREKAGRAPVALDQQSVGRLSRMDAMQVQAMAVASEGRRQARIRAVQAALERIGKDAFGCCLRCGEDIPEKRLDLDPAIAVCVSCAQDAR